MTITDCPKIEGYANKTRYGYNLSWTCPVSGQYMEADGEFLTKGGLIYHDVVDDSSETVLYIVIAEV